MAFDLNVWKQGVKARLQRWRPAMQRTGVNSLYAFLSAATVWPVVEAARAGNWAAPAALGGVLAGLGSNLLANRIQAWQDETTAAEDIASAIEAQPELRAELDTVLEKLDAFALARDGLTPEERAWFTGALRTELAALGNLGRFEATLTGSGALAQGPGASAASAQDNATALAIGTLYGDLYMGPKSDDPDEALAIYRRMLVESARHLPLRGVDVGSSDPTRNRKQLDLDQVYVALDTTTQVPLTRELKKQRESQLTPGREETRPLTVLEAVVAHRNLVILGDPGSGKSTFLNHLALCLVLHDLEPGVQWLRRLPQWPSTEAGVIPIPVILRDFARALPENAQRAAPRDLWAFIVNRLEAQNLGFAAKPLQAALEQGRALVLLDGLDEIATAEQRSFVRDAVAAFAQRYARSRLLVTCRTLSYQEPASQLERFQSVELAPFSQDKIRGFVGAWYAELARLGEIKTEEVSTLTARLHEAIRRPDLARLAPNPLLLTVMALVHTHQGRLPDTRAVLYEETIDILLWRWEQVKTTGDAEAPHMRRLLLESGRTDVDLKRVLWRLAFEAHRGGAAGDNEAVAGIGEWDLVKALAELHPERSIDWARQVVETMRLRAGLLLERAPEFYTFPHRTFQEYLAGAHLASAAQFATRAAALAAEGALWREVILLAVGRLVYLSGDTDKPLALVAELCPAHTAASDVAWRKVWLAGDALLEIGPNRVQDSELGKELLTRVRDRLVRLLYDGHLTAVERAAAGDSLGRLGDPRNAVMTVDEMEFCLVPAGPFWMGEGKESQRYEGLTYDYWIGRYAVTNAQYEAFVKAGGYGMRRYWPEAARAGYWQDGKFKGTFDDAARSHPYDYGEPFNLLNHPVVGVTWYEALAFTRWLGERLSEAGVLPQGWAVGLPNEPEWEKAARGGLTTPAAPLVRAASSGLAGAAVARLQPNSNPRRVYPWGDEIDKERVNYKETGVGSTSAMGCFPRGVGPYGAEEMSGNVWEWTRSINGPYPYPVGRTEREKREYLDASSSDWRLLRGGAYWADAGDVRCACRRGRDPGSRGDLCGFRVVVSPFVSLDSGI